MYKKLIVLASLYFASCSTPKQFTEQTYKEPLVSEKGEKLNFGDIFKNDNSENKLIQIYASKCKTSRARFIDVKEYQKKHPNTRYIFLSVDRNFKEFTEGKKLLPKGEAYFLPERNQGYLGRYLKLESVPRFFELDKENNIKKFKTHKAPSN